MIKQQIFKYAINKEYIKIVKFLINDKNIDSTYGNNIALRYTSVISNFEIFKLLFDKQTNLKINDLNYIVLLNSESGNIDILKYVVNNSNADLSFNYNQAITIAQMNNNQETVDFLWNDKNVKNTLNNDHLLLYNRLIKKNIKSKINKF
jgi:hypothetical protein